MTSIALRRSCWLLCQLRPATAVQDSDEADTCECGDEMLPVEQPMPEGDQPQEHEAFHTEVRPVRRSA